MQLRFENGLLDKDEKIKKLEIDLRKLEQYGRKKQLEIHNLEELTNEILTNIVIKFGNVTGLELKEKDIEAIH